jgi:KDO2-lipid IV(A) lauroyltransferase
MATAFRVRAAIERGVHVALLVDRAYPDDHVVVDFFGRPTPFLRSPVSLARFCRCPIVPAYLLSNHDDTYRSWFGDPIHVDPVADPEAEDRRVMGEVAKVVEQGVREDPGQWYNFFDYWQVAEDVMRGEAPAAAKPVATATA